MYVAQDESKIILNWFSNLANDKICHDIIYIQTPKDFIRRFVYTRSFVVFCAL